MCACSGPNREEEPSQSSPSSQQPPIRDGRDGGDDHRLLLWPAHAYMPQAKGVLPSQIAMREATARHCATVRPENKVCRVCGSHPVTGTSGLNSASVQACAGSWGLAKVRTWVRTRFAGLHPSRTKNGQGRKANAGAGLRPIRRLECRNRPTSEPDSVTVEKSALARTCDRWWLKKGQNGEGTHKCYEHRLTHRTQVDETFREARTRARV